MDELYKKLKENPVLYVARDIERAMGLPLETQGYFVISNSSDFAKSMAKGCENVELVKADKLLDTHELLQQKSQILNSKFQILVFKNTPQIERICQEQNKTLLNPPAELANKIEEKISQVEWLEILGRYLPEHEIKTCKEIEFRDEPFILQFNRAHTGSGTILIKTLEQLEQLQHKFPERPARVTKYIDGPVFTVNCVVSQSKILVGNISYQITGLEPFTDQKFATIGNDWGVVKNILNQEQIEEIKDVATDVGEKMKADGWKGLYGIDVIVGDEVYLIEINARQPASATYESQLQQTMVNRLQTTVFEAHLAALLDLDLSNYELAKIDDGSQIVLRNQDIRQKTEEVRLKEAGFNLIKYNNEKIGSDLLRIQSNQSIINSHNTFNDLGKKILSLTS